MKSTNDTKERKVTKRNSRPKISLEVKQMITLFLVIVGFFGLVGSIIWLLIPKTGFVAFDLRALSPFWMIGIPAFLVAVIALRDYLYHNKNFQTESGSWLKTMMDIALYISIIALVILPFVFGIIKIHLNGKFFVPVVFALVLAGTFVYSALNDPEQPPIKNYRNETEFEKYEREQREVL